MKKCLLWMFLLCLTIPAFAQHSTISVLNNPCNASDGSINVSVDNFIRDSPVYRAKERNCAGFCDDCFALPSRARTLDLTDPNFKPIVQTVNVKLFRLNGNSRQEIGSKSGLKKGQSHVFSGLDAGNYELDVFFTSLQNPGTLVRYPPGFCELERPFTTLDPERRTRETLFFRLGEVYEIGPMFL
ncbi:MAG: hypothetical protein AAFW73_26755 [Bacteroidota bacterium]